MLKTKVLQETKKKKKKKKGFHPFCKYTYTSGREEKARDEWFNQYQVKFPWSHWKKHWRILAWSFSSHPCSVYITDRWIHGSFPREWYRKIGREGKDWLARSDYECRHIVWGCNDWSTDERTLCFEVDKWKDIKLPEGSIKSKLRRRWRRKNGKALRTIIKPCSAERKSKPRASSLDKQEKKGKNGANRGGEAAELVFHIIHNINRILFSPRVWTFNLYLFFGEYGLSPLPILGFLRAHKRETRRERAWLPLVWTSTALCCVLSLSLSLLLSLSGNPNDEEMETSRRRRRRKRKRVPWTMTWENPYHRRRNEKEKNFDRRSFLSVSVPQRRFP